jgi:hypothetical protein
MSTCECKCCHPCIGQQECADRGQEQGQDCTDYEYFYWDALSPDECTEAGCAGHFMECPDSGSHNEHSVTEGYFHDCACACCHPDNLPSDGTTCDDAQNIRFYGWDAPTRSHCNAPQCRSRVSNCPDIGAHNEEGLVEALYLPTRYWMIELPTDHAILVQCDCTCGGTSIHSFEALTETDCSAAECLSRTDHDCVAPDTWDAIFHDCACACCHPGAENSAENPCVDYEHDTFQTATGSASECTADAWYVYLPDTSCAHRLAFQRNFSSNSASPEGSTWILAYLTAAES